MRLLSTMAAILVAAGLLPGISVAQHRDDTIEAAWDRATKRDTHVKPAEPARSDPRSGRESGDYPAWAQTRSPESRPWPALPANPTAKDIFQFNRSLIDSLSNLYCLSSNYIRTLNNRNEAAYAAHPSSPRREFAYSETPPSRPPHVRESLEAVYKELSGLIEQCLYGRQ